jgi:hypothetical protein
VSPWPLILVLLALIAFGGVGAYLLVDGTPSWVSSRTGGGGPSAPSAPPQLKAVTAFDPFGSPPGQEHNAAAPSATDGNPSTYWETETYHSSFAALGKPGVGLVLDAGKAVQLHELGIATETPGFTAVIRAGDAAGGPFNATVSASRVAERQAQFAIHGGKHRFYLIWITALPPNYESVRINEVKAS